MTIKRTVVWLPIILSILLLIPHCPGAIILQYFQNRLSIKGR